MFPMFWLRKWDSLSKSKQKRDHMEGLHVALIVKNVFATYIFRIFSSSIFNFLFSFDACDRRHRSVCGRSRFGHTDVLLLPEKTERKTIDGLP